MQCDVRATAVHYREDSCERLIADIAVQEREMGVAKHRRPSGPRRDEDLAPPRADR